MYVAKDGRKFGSTLQGRKHDRFLLENPTHVPTTMKSQQDLKEAPGGTSWENDLKMHGPVKKIVLERTQLGRQELKATHADGYEHQSVHPEAFRAHQIMGQLLGIEAPPAIQTHQRAKAHPIGPKETGRIARDDHEDDFAQKWEDFENGEER